MITFNVLLRQHGFDPKLVRLYRHQQDLSIREEYGVRGLSTPYHVWINDPDMFEQYQCRQAFNRRIDKGLVVASFVVSPSADTIFVGLFQSHGWQLANSDEWGNIYAKDDGEIVIHKFTPIPECADITGRLVIEWGAGTRAVLQHAARREKEVLELRREVAEKPFPGFIDFIYTVGKLNKLYDSWREVLSASRGIYLLTSPKGAHYVGGAYGSDGIWGRIKGYTFSGQGNEALEGLDLYNFTVSILDTVSSSASDHDIAILESAWKKKLGSRVHGLNRN